MRCLLKCTKVFNDEEIRARRLCNGNVIIPASPDDKRYDASDFYLRVSQ